MFIVTMDSTDSVSIHSVQVKLGVKLAGTVSDVISQGLQLSHTCYTRFTPHPKPAPETQAANPHEQDSSGRRHTEISVTAGSPEPVDLGTTDLSEDTSQEPLHRMVTAATASDGQSVKLSLWLQCVLPRLILTVITASNPGEELNTRLGQIFKANTHCH